MCVGKSKPLTSPMTITVKPIPVYYYDTSILKEELAEQQR